MIRDVKIEGQYATQVKEFVEGKRESNPDIKKIFNSNADLYFLSALIGLYDSKVIDTSEVTDENTAHVSSRTWLRSRGEFESLLSIFLKLEQKMHGEPYNINEIFLNHLTENEDFEKELNATLKSHAYYGIDKLYNKFNLSEGLRSIDIINSVIEKDLKTTEELNLEIENENFHSFEDIDFVEVLPNEIF